MTTTSEITARRRKADALVAAFEHLAAYGPEQPASPAHVLAVALYADDGAWVRAEALAGTHPASPATRAVVLDQLSRRMDATEAVPLPACPLEGLPV